MTHPNCKIQDVTSHVLFGHLSGLLIFLIIHFYYHSLYYRYINKTGKEARVEEGQNTMAIIK